MTAFTLTTADQPFTDAWWVSADKILSSTSAAAHSLTILQDTFSYVDYNYSDYGSLYYDYGRAIWITPNKRGAESDGWAGPDNNDSWTITVNGGVYCYYYSYGIGIETNNYKTTVNNILTVGSEGSVGGDFIGIKSSVASTITNSGLIKGDYAAAILFTDNVYNYYNAYSYTYSGYTYWYYDEPERATNFGLTHSTATKINSITNNVTGIIESTSGGGIVNDSLAALSITNSGQISGYQSSWEYNYDRDDSESYYYSNAAVDSGLGKLTLTNNAGGIISGNVVAGYVGNIITNSGEINGSIVSHVYNAYNYETYMYMLDIDRDGDIYDLSSGGAAQVNTYVTAVNTITNNIGATVRGFVDSYDYYSYYNGLSYYYAPPVAMALSAISDKVINNGDIFGDIQFRSGNADALTNTGAVYGDVELGTGGNTLINTKSTTGDGFIEGDVSSFGKTTITNAGVLNGDVRLEWIGNTVTNNVNSIIHGTIYGDFLDSAFDDYYWYFREITASGFTKLYVDTNQNGSFADTLNTGFHAVNDLRSSATLIVNTITNNGLINGVDENNYNYYDKVAVALDLSSGRDVITNSATGKIDGSVYLNEGADSFSNLGVVAGSIDFGWGLGDNVLTNTGSATGGYIEGSVNSGGKLTLLTQTGNIGGNIFLGWIGNSITNSGTIAGSITSSFVNNSESELYNYYYLPEYNSGKFDVLKNNLLTLTPNTTDDKSLYELGTSTTIIVNTITNNGLIGGTYEVGTYEVGSYYYYDYSASNGYEYYYLNSFAMDLSEGRDVVTNAATGRILSGLYFNSGADQLTNLGVIAGPVDMGWGLGVNTIVNTGSTTGGVINGDVVSGATLTMISQTGVINGSLELGWVGNTITNSNIINGAIFSEIGVRDEFSDAYYYNYDYIDYFNGLIDTDKDGSFSDTGGFLTFTSLKTTAVNTIVNNGSIYGLDSYVYDDYNYNISNLAMDLSEGRDIITNNATGRINGQIVLNEGNDTVTNSGLIMGSIDLGSGSNTVTNSNQIYGNITSSYEGDGTAGNTITNTGYIYGSLDLSGSNDTISTSKVIQGDVYVYDGNDTVNVLVGGKILGYVELGDGNDAFNTAATAATAALIDKVSDGEGADTIKLLAGNDILYVADDSDVDNYSGGSGSDTLDLSAVQDSCYVNLSASAVTLNGTSVSAYKLFSNSVSDTVDSFEKFIGSDYEDIFVAGTSKETLTGGGGSDTFYFASTSASTKSKALQDIITDFVSGEDFIDLSAFSGTFSFAGINTNFSGSANSLRAYYIAGATVIEGDLSGDKIADFGITLTGLISITETDFIL